MAYTLTQAFNENFLGNSPGWYKATVIGFLVANPVVFITLGPFVAGWLLVVEFIFTLAMALKCYPLQPGGLLAIEAIAIGMASPQAVYNETLHNFPVIMLMMFMVAGIYFLRDLLLFCFTKIILGIRSKTLLSLAFCFTAALLSAFLDALTVVAVVITVATGFYGMYHKFASGKRFEHEHDHGGDSEIHEHHRKDLAQFRDFLRSLMMHAAVGTTLGGVATLVGEPQNLLIAHEAGWQFQEFFLRMMPVSMPTLAAGLFTCVALEKLKWFGYGVTLPEPVRRVLTEYEANQTQRRDSRERAVLIVQALAAGFLVLALAFHVAEVGIIGLAVVVLATALNGVTEEHRIGRAFQEALPFTALLVVFFAIIAVIHQSGMFTPIIHWALSFQGTTQLVVFYLANGLLSMVSDNVFVATIYITEAKSAFNAGIISLEQFNLIAVAINTGSNIPSVATPNGQAAFLFLLTSALAPLIRLSYLRMLWMALPYALVMTGTGLLCVAYLL